MTEFSFVVARPWAEEYPDQEGLAIYTYGAEIQHGCEEHAIAFLQYVKKVKPEYNWAVYKINFEKIVIK